MISVVIPVYNEEEIISNILRQVSIELKNSFKEYEIILVNDGSTDRTAEIIKAQNDDRMLVITHPENMGYGKSLLDGIIAAKHDCIAIIDADGSYSPKDIRRLYEYYPQYDMVVGARRGDEYRSGLFKRPARMLFQCLVEYAAGRKVDDVNSGIRIIKKSIILKFKDSLCAGFSFTTTCTLVFLLNYYFVKYLPVLYFKREGKSKIKYWRDTLRTGQIILESILYYNPLKLFLLLAICNGLFGCVVWVLNYYLFRADFLSIMSAICIASFVPIFCTGLIANQLKKTRDSGKHGID